jgi:hypothetical protein
VAPITFGVISEKTMIRNEMTSVPIAYASLSSAKQLHRHQARQGARGGDHQRIADQDAAQQSVGALQHLRDAQRAAVLLRDEVLQR